MPTVLDPFQFVLIAVAGWMNQRQLQMIEYLREESRIRDQIPEIPFLNWFDGTRQIGRCGTRILVEVPDESTRSFLEREYAAVARGAISNFAIHEVCYVTRDTNCRAWASLLPTPVDSCKARRWISGYNEIAMRVSVAEAKNRLPELIKAVENGEAVTICRHGKPVVELVRRSHQTGPEIEFGGLRHLNIELDADWWKPMTKEEAEAFLGGRD